MHFFLNAFIFILHLYMFRDARSTKYKTTYLSCFLRFPVALKWQRVWERIKEARNIPASRSRIKIIRINSNRVKTINISLLGTGSARQRHYIQQAPRCLCSTKLPRLFLQLAGETLRPFNTRRFSRARSKCNCLIRWRTKLTGLSRRWLERML